MNHRQPRGRVPRTFAGYRWAEAGRTIIDGHHRIDPKSATQPATGIPAERH